MKPDQLAETIIQTLLKYPPAMADAIKKAIDKLTNNGVQKLKNSSPRRTGRYASGWRKKEVENVRLKKRNVIHNARYYRLTHLLEKQHLLRNGKRSKAQPHIEAVEQEIIKELPKEIESAVKNYEPR